MPNLILSHHTQSFKNWMGDQTLQTARLCSCSALGFHNNTLHKWGDVSASNVLKWGSPHNEGMTSRDTRIITRREFRAKPTRSLTFHTRDTMMVTFKITSLRRDALQVNTTWHIIQREQQTWQPQANYAVNSKNKNNEVAICIMYSCSVCPGKESEATAVCVCVSTLVVYIYNFI